MIGKFAYIVTYPVLDITDMGSSNQLWFQSPENYASTKVSTPLDLSGEYIMPWLAFLLSLSFLIVPVIYLIILSIAFS